MTLLCVQESRFRIQKENRLLLWDFFTLLIWKCLNCILYYEISPLRFELNETFSLQAGTIAWENRVNLPLHNIHMHNCLSNFSLYIIYKTARSMFSINRLIQLRTKELNVTKNIMYIMLICSVCESYNSIMGCFSIHW